MSTKSTSREVVLPFQFIRKLVGKQLISSPEASIEQSQIQPASLDLRLGALAYRVCASFLPSDRAKMADKLRYLSLYTLDLAKGAVLERGCVYVIPLLEQLALDGGLSASGAPKSSSGRLDVLVRLLSDYGDRFDQLPVDYQGRLYAEVAPRTFAIKVRTGSCLLQLRLQQRCYHQSLGRQEQYSSPQPLQANLQGREVAGYQARRYAGVIDVDQLDYYDPLDYWRPLRISHDAMLLEPGDLYILCSQQEVKVAADRSASMRAYDVLLGEFRAHYAGFFDPGFHSQAVMEVRAHDVPFLIEHGQVLGQLVYEPLIEPTDRLYSPNIGSSYQGSGLSLSKHFKRCLVNPEPTRAARPANGQGTQGEGKWPY